MSASSVEMLNDIQRNAYLTEAADLFELRNLDFPRTNGPEESMTFHQSVDVAKEVFQIFGGLQITQPVFFAFRIERTGCFQVLPISRVVALAQFIDVISVNLPRQLRSLEL